MTTRLGINGFGRIGRSVMRAVVGRPEFEVVAINDVYAAEQLAYLLRFDSVMGIYPEPVSAGAGELVVGGKAIRLSAAREPRLVPWREAGVDFVVESTGVFLTRAELTGHLEAGARRVVLTVPPEDALDAMIVMGVNDDRLRPDHRLVSNASCTTNCLAPIVHILDDAFGLRQGFMTTAHAYTNDQRLADVPHLDLRRSRAAAVNLIPTSSGAARAVGKILPHLAGRLDGMAVRVPVPDGSLVELVCRLERAADAAAINAAVRAAAEGPLRRIVEYSDLPLVSGDIIGNSHSSIFDSLSTVARGDGFARVVSWYDNEWGYSNRVVDVLTRLASFDH
ncbi:MAG: type I glyceraldehyde-3-phosphate dehydrogenase [Thermoanaerobaculia bacterium]|nr:MAG: type I glyceraldehyde-3-phosphate dehydrogenase [Thermoanaerobaculia bacterium]